MKRQNIAIGVIILMLAVGGAFYGGMQYGARNVQAKNAQDQQGRGGFAGGAGGGQRGTGSQRGGMQAGSQNGPAGDFVGGEVIAKDDSSVTIKTRDGGSKIVFLSDKTSIDKSVSGVIADLSIGQQVTAQGKTNTDGSIAAQNIQIRPLPTK
ncbi:MAG: hypothetical protein WCI36_00415 [bacterium]